MFTADGENPFRYWLIGHAIKDPEAYIDWGDKVIDAEMKDGRTLWGMFYGEAPRESIYDGTKDILLTGHVHFEDASQFESYLPTLGGEVLRVITDKETGTLVEGPTTLSPAEEMVLIESLEDQLHPVD